MLEHLEANGVATQTTLLGAGAPLQVAPGEERLVSRANYDLGYGANTMLRREYREPFVLSDVV